jgi:hypothetical protein
MFSVSFYMNGFEIICDGDQRGELIQRVRQTFIHRCAVDNERIYKQKHDPDADIGKKRNPSIYFSSERGFEDRDCNQESDKSKRLLGKGTALFFWSIQDGVAVHILFKLRILDECQSDWFAVNLCVEGLYSSAGRAVQGIQRANDHVAGLRGQRCA